MILCAACTQNAEATKAEKLWDGEKVQLSADGQSIELSQDLIMWFYNYNNDNWAEMAYLAEFTVLHLAEAETAETENPTPNARAIHEFAAKEGLDSADEKQILKNILVREDYGDILEMTYNLTAEFRLTGDKDAPFQYLSCHRQYLDGGEYDLKDM